MEENMNTAMAEANNPVEAETLLYLAGEDNLVHVQTEDEIGSENEPVVLS